MMIPFEKDGLKFPSKIYVPVLLLIFGAFLLLIGLRKLSQKLYLLVFLSFPAAFFITTLFLFSLGTGLEGLSTGCFLISFAAPYYVLQYVRNFYGTQTDKRKIS